MYSPRWLFLYPGVALVLFGIFATALTLPGLVVIAGVGFDIHTFVVGCISIVIGIQSISFAVITRRFATLRGWLPPGHFSESLISLTLERTLLIAAIPALFGAGGLIYCVANWASTGFGALQYAAMLKLLILSMTGLAVGIQLALAAFLSAIIDIPLDKVAGAISLDQALNFAARSTCTGAKTKAPRRSWHRISCRIYWW